MLVLALCISPAISHRPPQSMSDCFQAATEKLDRGLDKYVFALPKELANWRWAAIAYFKVIHTWTSARAYRSIAAAAKEHIRLGSIKSIHNGGHRRFEC